MREDLLRGDWFGNPPTTLSDVSSLFDQGPGPNVSPPEPPSITPQPEPTGGRFGTQPLPRTNTDPYAGLPTPPGYHLGPQGQFLPPNTMLPPGTTINAGKPIQPQLNALFPTQPWPANSPYRNPAPAGQETSPYYTHPAATSTGGGDDWIGSALSQAQSTDDPAYWRRVIAEDNGAHDQAYWQMRIARGDGALAVRQGQMSRYGDPSAQGSQGYQGAYQAPGGAYSATNPFDDPATKNYIDFLNSRIQQLLQPYNNPDAGPLQEWMRKYFAQLQGPTYTPAQQGTIQTQALDPIEQQRQAELKHVAYTMASRGITPGSGPYLQAERDINLKYDQIRAQIQGGLAVNEINLGRQNQAQAGNVGGQLAQFTQGLFGTQEARANQALGLAQEIPNLAQQRIAQAVNLLQGSNVNPAQLLQVLQGFQQQGIGQSNADAAFYAQLFASIAKQFGLG